MEERAAEEEWGIENGEWEERDLKDLKDVRDLRDGGGKIAGTDVCRSENR